MLQKQSKSDKPVKVAENLYRNPSNGNYLALVKVRGKQKKQSLKTTDRAIANRRLADFREKAKRLHGANNRSMRFGELAEIWLEAIKPTLKASSLKRRVTSVEGLKPFFGEMPVRSIGYTHIENWSKKRGSQVSARSYNIDLETLRKIFGNAIDRGMILDDPTEKFNRLKEPLAAIKTFSLEEFSILVKELRDSPHATRTGASDMIEFLAYSGLRVGEAREVLFGDIDLGKKLLRVTGGQIGTKNHHDRNVPLFPNLHRLVGKIIENREECNPGERIFKIDTPRKALELAIERTGVTRYSVHALRKFFVTNALEKNVTFPVIAAWIGHQDGGTLLAKRYGHLRKEFSDGAAQAMNFEVV